MRCCELFNRTEDTELLEKSLGHPDPSQRHREILRYGTFEHDAFTTPRMRERQSPGVQAEPVEAELHTIAPIVGAVPVPNVSCKRMVDTPQMTSNLMPPPRSRPGLDERKSPIGDE